VKKELKFFYPVARYFCVEEHILQALWATQYEYCKANEVSVWPKLNGRRARNLCRFFCVPVAKNGHFMATGFTLIHTASFGMFGIFARREENSTLMGVLAVLSGF
jgi:hypothetical protein